MTDVRIDKINIVSKPKTKEKLRLTQISPGKAWIGALAYLEVE